MPRAPEHHFEHFYHLSLQAAASGLGVAMGPLALVHDDVQAGRLVAPLGFVADGTSYVLISTLPLDDARVATLLSWLREYVRRLPEEAQREAGR